MQQARDWQYQMPSIPGGTSEGVQKMKVIQLNLNHCEAAQDLLQQLVIEMRIDVAILCDQYRNTDSTAWATDVDGRSAVWACGDYPMQEATGGSYQGFIRVKINDIYIYGCYARPSASIKEFKAFLDRLTNDARNRSPVLIAGDFNAWALEWGSRETNSRGTALLEAFACLELTLMNTGNAPTFCRAKATSIIDLTFVSEGIADRGAKWRVSEEYTHCDHHAIVYEIKDRNADWKQRRWNRISVGWKAKALDVNIFHLIMELVCSELQKVKRSN
jgi:hypothetical protein